MSTARKILHNTFSQILGKAFIGVIGIIVTKMITSYLGAAGYGQYTTAIEFLAFFGIIADLGLYTVGVREMAKDESKIPMIIGNILSVRTIIAVIALSSAIIAGFLIPKYAGTKIPLAIAATSVSTLLNLLTATITTVLQVHLKIQYNSFASVVGKIISVIYMAFVVFIIFPNNQDLGFYHIIFAGIFGNFAMLAITFYYSSKLTKIRYRIDKEFWLDVLVKSIPYGIALILNTIYFRIGSLMLSFYRSPAEVGIYGVPMRILEAVGIIPLYFMNSVLPSLTRSIQRKDGSHGRIIQFAFDFLVIGCAPIVAGTFVLAYPLIYLISTPEFLSDLSIGFIGSDIVLSILIIATVFSFLNTLFGLVLVADNHQSKLLIRNLIGAAMTFTLDRFLVPIYGVRAAAIDNVITEFYIAVASYLLARHYLKFKLTFTTTFKALFSALVMAVIVYYLKDPAYALMKNKSLVLLIPLGGIVYFGMLYLTKTITPEMIALIRKPKPVINETTENF